MYPRRLYNKTARKSAGSTMRLSEPPKPTKRKRTVYDLEHTFEVVVGKSMSQSKRFTIHTNVFTGRSGVLAAIHSSEADSQHKPVDLSGEDPELFQAYLNCVYFGSDTIEKWADTYKDERSATQDETDLEKQAAADLLFEKLIRFYLLADRLVDYRTANMVISKIIRFRNDAEFLPTRTPISLAYASTVKGSPLRTLLRDLWIYGSDSTQSDRECFCADGFPSECLQDIAREMLRVVGEDSSYFDRTVRDICLKDACHYHQHDERHLKCVPGDSDEDSEVSED